MGHINLDCSKLYIGKMSCKFECRLVDHKRGEENRTSSSLSARLFVKENQKFICKGWRKERRKTEKKKTLNVKKNCWRTINFNIHLSFFYIIVNVSVITKYSLSDCTMPVSYTHLMWCRNFDWLHCSLIVSPWDESTCHHNLHDCL